MTRLVVPRGATKHWIDRSIRFQAGNEPTGDAIESGKTANILLEPHIPHFVFNTIREANNVILSTIGTAIL